VCVRRKKKPQISPLRCAPVEMTSFLQRGFVPLLERYGLKFVTNLSSRPELPWASDPPKVMKNASVQQPLSKEPSPFPLSSRAYPDFLLHSSHQRLFCGSRQREPHAVDRSHNSRQEIRGSRGICSSADLSWKCFSTERSAAEWRDLRFFFSGYPGYELAVILRMVLVVLMPFTVGTISTRPPQVVISSAPTMVAVV
jgi:hypothetical protein